MSAAAMSPCSLNEVVDALQPRDGGRYLDGTFGAGGYTTRDARSRRLPGDRDRPRSRRHRRRPGAGRALCAAPAPDRGPLRRHGRAVWRPKA